MYTHLDPVFRVGLSPLHMHATSAFWSGSRLLYSKQLTFLKMTSNVRCKTSRGHADKAVYNTGRSTAFVLLFLKDWTPPQMAKFFILVERLVHVYARPDRIVLLSVH